MLTIKSDDMLGRVQAFSALIQGNKIPGSTVPETFKLLVRKLNGLGLGLEAYSAEEVEEGTSEESVEEIGDTDSEETPSSVEDIMKKMGGESKGSSDKDGEKISEEDSDESKNS
jgi:polyhydroxyalkanoate synthesis regulator phasin